MCYNIFDRFSTDKNRNDEFKKIGVTLAIFLIATGYRIGNVQAPKIIAYSGEDKVWVQGNSVIPYRNAFISTEMAVLGVLAGGDDINGVLVKIGKNRDLIECLIKNESEGRIDVYGDARKAFGILQFHFPTFEHFKKKYGMEYLDYKNPVDQIILCNEMLNNNLGYHWTTFPICQMN